MANLNWSKTSDCPRHVRHVRDVQDSNNCRLPFWRKQNVPKRHHQPPHPSQRHTGQPPELLRLDNAGESVEEYPHHISHGARVSGRSGRPNTRTPSNSFLESIWSKVGYPLQSSRACLHLAKPHTSEQPDMNLDRLVEKFGSACDMDQSSPKYPMASQQCQQHMVQPAPARGAPPMTFNGGPYITWSSQNNCQRTFPAYYRFLNFLHFHPYNNATRISRPCGSPVKYPDHPWSDVAQFQWQSPRRPQNKSRTHQMSNYHVTTNHQRHFRKFCGSNATNNGSGMMQNKQSMSHQKAQRHSSMSMKTTLPHDTADAHKEHARHFKTSRLKTSSAVESEQSSQLNVNGTLLPKDNCQLESKLHHDAAPCATLSEAMSTKSCANRKTDNLPSYQEGQEFNHQTKTSETKCTEPSVLKDRACCQSTEQKVCSNRSITSHVSIQPQRKPIENPTGKEPTDTSASRKEMHSSIAYLLGSYIDNSASNDIDFSEEDEELGDEIDDSSRKLLESFQTDDPYNPMYGWKCLTGSSNQGASCKNPLTEQEAADASNTVDLALTLNDSGLFVTETASSESSSFDDPENSKDSFTSSSDEWSDSGCDEEEEQKMWDSLSRCVDPYDPMGGWRLKPSSASSATKSTNVQESNITDFSCKAIALLKSSLKPLPLHEISCKSNSSSKKHPSVSFILSADDSDSSSPDDSDNEETNDSNDILHSSANYEAIWESFQFSNDPYDPLNGWQCRSPSSSLQRSASSPSELCKADKEDEDTATALQNPLSPAVDSHDGGQPQTPTGNVFLIQSCSTKCLKTVWKKARQRDKERKAKKVSFCAQEPVVISPEVPMWEEEYMEARRGHWEELARDRCRFQRRIRQAELTIAPCFTPSHRLKMYRQLYS